MNNVTEVKYKVIKNPDEKEYKDVKRRVKANNGYCPCAMEKSPDTKCPCKTFRETQECECGLYVKVPYYD